MGKAKLVKALLAQAENKVGMLADISSAITESGVNIQGINAYAVDDQAYFRLLVTDNEKAKEALEAKECQVTEQEVVAVEMPDKVGVLKETAEKLKAAGIDLSFIYGTTCNCGGDCLVVFGSNNNHKAQEILD